MPRANGFAFNSPRALFAQNSFRKFKPSSGRSNQEQPNSATNQSIPLLNQGLEGYSEEELLEYRAVFNMFDADRSGAIALDELDAATRHLGLEMTTEELDKIIDEVDQRGNHQIDFDEFCVVMRRLTIKKKTWHEITKECFTVFDRSESGVVSKKDFQIILREIGDITDPQVVEEIFNEADVDGNGLIDFEEFAAMVQNYMLDEDLDVA